MSGRIFFRSLFLLLCGLAACCTIGSAAAQDAANGKIRWRTDYNSARREALDKKLPIVIDFFTNPCHFCDLLDANFFQDARVAKLINERFIPLKINAQDPHNVELLEKLKITAFPTLVLATYDGKVCLPPGAIVGYKEPAFLYEQLLRVMGGASDPEWMLTAQAQAQKHWQAKDYARAIAVLRSIVEDGKARPVQVSSRKMLQDIEDMGQQRLAQAREFVKNRQTNEAIELINDTMRSFAGLQSARDASGLLTEVMQQSAELRNQQHTRKAQELLVQAQEAYKTKDYLVCLERCENLVKNYGDLNEAKEGSLIAANIKSDSQWLRGAGDALVERLGQVWIDLGENYLRSGQPEQARYYFERVIRAFPGSGPANYAQIRLGQFVNFGGRPVPIMTPLPGH